MTGRAAVAAALLATAPYGAVANDCTDTGVMETNFGQVHSEEKDIPSGTSADITQVIHDVANYRYLKAMVRVDPRPGRRWTLFVRDSTQRVLDVVSDAGASRLGLAWTSRVPNDGSPIYFDFQADPESGPPLLVSRMLLMPKTATNPYYSVQDRNAEKFVPIADGRRLTPETRILGDHVGMMIGSWDNRNWCCTAVAIAPDVVLTNWHCGGIEGLVRDDEYWTGAICDRISFDFSWDGDGMSREFECTEVLQQDAETDFAVVRVTPRNRTDRLRPVRSWGALPGEAPALTLIQHPLCREKQATVEGACRWRDARMAGWRGAAGADFSHTCDTYNGSSGGAVFDAKRRFVGLHHLGFQMSGGTCDKKNKAIHATTLIDKLGSRSTAAIGGRPVIAE